MSMLVYSESPRASDWQRSIAGSCHEIHRHFIVGRPCVEMYFVRLLSQLVLKLSQSRDQRQHHKSQHIRVSINKQTGQFAVTNECKAPVKVQDCKTTMMTTTITFDTEASTDTELGVGASRIKHVFFFNFSDCCNTQKQQ